MQSHSVLQHQCPFHASVQARLGDSNRNLAARVLLLLGELAKAMGAAFDRVGRPLLGTAVANLSDSKSQVCIALVCPSYLYLIQMLFQTLSGCRLGRSGCTQPPQLALVSELHRQNPLAWYLRCSMASLSPAC